MTASEKSCAGGDGARRRIDWRLGREARSRHRRRLRRSRRRSTAAPAAPGAATAATPPAPTALPVHAETPAAYQQMVNRYCVSCHNEKARIPAGAPLALEKANLADPGPTPTCGSASCARSRSARCRRRGRRRPAPRSWTRFTDHVVVDARSEPRPSGTTRAATCLHRLNRTEYANAVRDLVGVTVDVTELLPSDGGDFGFDNIASALTTSPLLLERYLTAALRVSATWRSATPTAEPGTATYSVSTVVTQTQARRRTAARHARRPPRRAQLPGRR